MIAEFITGLFAGVTGAYLLNKHNQNKKEQQERQAKERVTFSLEARERYQNGDLYWWQKYENKELISKGKLPENKKDLEQMLEKARTKMKEEEEKEGGFPPPTLSPVAKRLYNSNQ